MSEVKERYDREASDYKYVTSKDMNLRELEIDAISKYMNDGLKILDIGCANGYTISKLAGHFKSYFIGMDFSKNMINKAKLMAKRKSRHFKGTMIFQVQDVLTLPILTKSNTFDIIITERLLINLPDTLDQEKAIKSIHKLLKPKGKFLMMEATIDGLERLNAVRNKVGLEPTPITTKENRWINRFREEHLKKFLPKYFKILDIQRFGLYFFISRVVHPLLVKNPKFDAKINKIAYDLATKLETNYKDIGGSALYVLEKI